MFFLPFRRETLELFLQVGDPITEVEIISEWAEGYCANVTVNNVSSRSLRWLSLLDLKNAKINNIWGAQVTIVADVHQFSGLDWNADLAPEGRADFGYCAALDVSDKKPVVL